MHVYGHDVGWGAPPMWVPTGGCRCAAQWSLAPGVRPVPLVVATLLGTPCQLAAQLHPVVRQQWRGRGRTYMHAAVAATVAGDLEHSCCSGCCISASCLLGRRLRDNCELFGRSGRLVTSQCQGVLHVMLRNISVPLLKKHKLFMHMHGCQPAAATCPIRSGLRSSRTEGDAAAR
jgi:hypothetical protein